ncbi:MAG: hypothetical protein KF850_28245, partial [Labilithrix sp.]|nr:hypothetical protein [Labilithrix sp.]
MKPAGQPRAARPTPPPAPALPKSESVPPPAPQRPSQIIAKGYVPLVNIPPLPPPPKNLKLNVGD